MGRVANQNVNDFSEFTVTGSQLIDLARQGDPPVIAQQGSLTPQADGPDRQQRVVSVIDSTVSSVGS